MYEACFQRSPSHPDSWLKCVGVQLGTAVDSWTVLLADKRMAAVSGAAAEPAPAGREVAPNLGMCMYMRGTCVVNLDVQLTTVDMWGREMQLPGEATMGAAAAAEHNPCRPASQAGHHPPAVIRSSSRPVPACQQCTHPSDPPPATMCPLGCHAIDSTLPSILDSILRYSAPSCPPSTSSSLTEPSSQAAASCPAAPPLLLPAAAAGQAASAQMAPPQASAAWVALPALGSTWRSKQSVRQGNHWCYVGVHTGLGAGCTTPPTDTGLPHPIHAR